MRERSHISLLACVAIAVLLAGCEGDTADDTSAKPSGKSATPTAGEGPDAVQSIVGKPLSVSQTEVVIETEDGERTFTIAADDLESVDPAHIGSHVGIENLAFRIYYRKVDGIDHAVASEEVDLQTESVGPQS